MYRADTIIASATASGRAAVAIVRVSGREAFHIAQQLLRLETSPRPVPWKLHRSTARDPLNGEAIDDVLAVWMPGPRTYTGEDIVEIHCHGSPVVVESLIAAGTRIGARVAERGEFTRRAVLNGRMDLIQAEAVADLVDSRVRGGARLAWTQLQGALSQRLRKLREAILHVLADVEANVDFSDDDLPEEKMAPRRQALRAVESEISAILTGFVAGRRWREGYRVVFTGPPNVGKSSLVNALLGYGRMIVSDEPGTTRDTVEEAIDLEGCAFVLTDTAGLRECSSQAESLAVMRTRQKLEEADIVVCVFDSSAPAPAPEEEPWTFPEDAGCIVVMNKCDLPRRLEPTEVRRALGSEPYAVLETSALTGAGCDTFADTLVEFAHRCSPDVEQATAGISRVRHRSALERARVALLAAIELLQHDDGSELVSIELRGALAELAGITDPVDNEDVLDRIFQDFCIGK